MSFDLQTNIEAKLVDIESLPPIGYDRVIKYADAELARIKPIYDDLLQARHTLFDLPNSALSSDRPITDQLYNENSYNAQWTKDDLRLRKAAVEFHMETEKLDDDPQDDENLRRHKKAYRQSIIEAAEFLGGYLAPLEPGKSPNELDRHLGIRESTLSPESPLNADVVVIPTAAALSNHMRIRDTTRNIESGALTTQRIIVTTGERTIPDAEKAKVEAKGYRSGDTEFEAALYAFEDITGITIADLPIKTIPATYGTNTPETKYIQAQVAIGQQNIDLIVLEAGYDRENRHDSTGRSVGRASTDETFYAALPFIEKEPGLVVIESHDAWAPYQEVIGSQVFGLYADKNVVAIGPFKDDRIVLKDDGTIDITSAQGVVDEIGKCHDDLMKLRMRAENAKSPEMALLGRLVRPIPDMSTSLDKKQNYREHPIKSSPEFENEPLVNAWGYGLAAQSYYSRENEATTDPIPGVPKEVYIRQSLAETLAIVNSKLDNPIIAAFFGGEVELYIEEGIRDRAIQKKVREEYYPDLVRNDHPGITDTEVEARVDAQFAKPSESDESPAPHETGAAFDIILRYKQDSKEYVPDCKVPMGLKDGDTGDVITPDYYEHVSVLTEKDEDSRIRNFRRAFYNIMTGSAFDMNTGFVVNPTELWHWSRHDQLAAKVSGQDAALYGHANKVQ